MILLAKTKEQCLSLLSEFILDRGIAKELGEAIFFDEGDFFYIKSVKGRSIGFAAINVKKNTTLKYMYVLPEFRGNGYFGELHKALFKDCRGKIKLVATDSALPIYQKYGYQIEKSFVNYHKLSKDAGINEVIN